MLRYELLHPPLLQALATAGHGSKILIADGNYPFLTVKNPRATLIHLNISPGLIGISELLPIVQTAVNFESATLMRPADGADVPAHGDYRETLGPDVPFDYVDRFDFYELARSEDVGLIIATADQRLYANLMLTVGLR